MQYNNPPLKVDFTFVSSVSTLLAHTFIVALLHVRLQFRC